MTLAYKQADKLSPMFSNAERQDSPLVLLSGNLVFFNTIFFQILNLLI